MQNYGPPWGLRHLSLLTTACARHANFWAPGPSKVPLARFGGSQTAHVGVLVCKKSKRLGPKAIKSAVWALRRVSRS